MIWSQVFCDTNRKQRDQSTSGNNPPSFGDPNFNTLLLPLPALVTPHNHLPSPFCHLCTCRPANQPFSAPSRQAPCRHWPPTISLRHWSPSPLASFFLSKTFSTQALSVVSSTVCPRPFPCWGQCPKCVLSSRHSVAKDT